MAFCLEVNVLLTPEVHTGQDILHDFPFNVTAHEVVLMSGRRQFFFGIVGAAFFDIIFSFFVVR